FRKAAKYLTQAGGAYSPQAKPTAVSPYHGRILEGVCIVPRTLWFIKFVPGAFGLNPDTPSIESLVLPDAKEPWKNVTLKGEVESEFIFLTVTGKYLLPFKPQFLPIVLPIKKGPRVFKILSSTDLRKAGKLKMANWVDEARNAWRKNATSTSLKNYPEPMDYVNFRNKLVLQRQNVRYFVIYTGSGTHIAAGVVDAKRTPDIQISNVKIPTAGFVADHKTYWFGTNNEEEAYYLTAILNSEELDQMIKPLQTRGKFGPRDIGRLPFEFNIPQFDSNNRLHKQIAALGLKATKEATNLPKTSRLKMKTTIPSMKEIDRLVHQLLNIQNKRKESQLLDSAES
ncbi:hypothetical protein MUP59_04275, partial [Candidatus Bathyarchaeota archaeon]|nr:hypothetical protein [Candidatus Bathyarchaeota archaeon]